MNLPLNMLLPDAHGIQEDMGTDISSSEEGIKVQHVTAVMRPRIVHDDASVHAVHRTTEPKWHAKTTTLRERQSMSYELVH